ncbi:MAG: hypothetical protein JKX76_00710 [Colwellia sp.]|nr:hypothetical protein [Colwellia sp.]
MSNNPNGVIKKRRKKKKIIGGVPVSNNGVIIANNNLPLPPTQSVQAQSVATAYVVYITSSPNFNSAKVDESESSDGSILLYLTEKNNMIFDQISIICSTDTVATFKLYNPTTEQEIHYEIFDNHEKSLITMKFEDNKDFFDNTEFIELRVMVEADDDPDQNEPLVTKIDQIEVRYTSYT